jgi:carboxyl-terminal processing protease
MPRRNLYAITMVAAVSIFCWQASHGARPKDEMMELYGVFVDAVEQVETNYVRPVSRRELLESALKGMLQNLDPHSQFINESEWKSFRKQIEGRYGGIGIQVEVDADTERLKVVAPMVGTPAYAAGVLSGDLILEIDGQTTDGMTPDRAVEVLTGRVGTAVKLKVKHEAENQPETLTMNRAIIDVPSVLGDSRKADDTWNYMLDPDRKIGYVRISSFIQNTTEELKHALAELKEQGMKALILDLRDNPGGLLSSAVEVSDLFIDDGVIVSTKGRNTPTKTYEAQKDAVYTDFPMVVLVNQGSASAAEIVSACLQDHKRAKVVGQRSFGKGSVQNILELEDGNSVLKLTVATYQRPSGKNIHRFKNAKDTDEWGVSPSTGLEVKLSPDQYFSYARGRRQRDLLSSRRARPKPAQGETPKEAEAAKEKDKDENGKPKTEVAKEKEKDKDENGKPKTEVAKAVEPPHEDNPAKEQAKAGPRPFVDVQRDKAIAVVKEELTKAMAKS